MLVPTRQSSPRLSHATRFAIASAALVACLVPTIQSAPAQAQAPSTAKGEGRIYVSARYRNTAGTDEQRDGFYPTIAIDPIAGAWQMIVESASAGRLSPDRRTLVFYRHQDGIWKCESDGQFPIKISDKDGRPLWSPDGKYLVVGSTEIAEGDSKLRTETWRLDADGRNRLKLPIPDTDVVDDWSPDGGWFVTISDRHPPYGSYQLYLMKTDGTQERRLTEGGMNIHARFSPDGKKILYSRQTRAEGNSIWTVDVDGENAMELVKEVGLTSPDGAFWSPDGKQIAVIMFDWELVENGKKLIRDLPNANFRIEIMDADGTNRRPLTLQGAKFLHIGGPGDWR